VKRWQSRPLQLPTGSLYLLAFKEEPIFAGIRKIIIYPKSAGWRIDGKTESGLRASFGNYYQNHLDFSRIDKLYNLYLTR